MTTEHHELNEPDEGTLEWHTLLNENWRSLDSIVPIQGAKSERPTADGTQPPYLVTAPNDERAVYVDDAGTWVKVAEPVFEDSGTYTGDGTTGRTIALGFQPSKVILVDEAGNVYDRYEGLGTGVYGADPSGELSFAADGFTVGDNVIDADPNTNGETYSYKARQ